MKKASILLAVAVVVAITGTPSAHFAERTDSLFGFAARSDLVVVGVVRKARQVEEKGHTRAPGAVRVKIEEVLYQRPSASGEPIGHLAHGGEPARGEVGVLVEGLHQPRYSEGERVLLFAERKGGVHRSLQSRAEKVSLAGTDDPTLAAVRRTIAALEEKDESRRLGKLKVLTLAGLRSADARLREDAVFDLSRRGWLDAVLTDGEIAGLGELAASEATPLVVRQGIAAKLGVLVRGGKGGALAPLERLARTPKLAAVRVAAVNSLGMTTAHESVDTLIAALGDGDRFVRFAAVEALERAGSGESAGPLAERTTDSDGRVRFAALKALFRLGTPEARAFLEGLRARATPEERQLLAQAAAQSISH